MTLHLADGTTLTVTEPKPSTVQTHGFELLTDSTSGTAVAVNWAHVTHITGF